MAIVYNEDKKAFLYTPPSEDFMFKEVNALIKQFYIFCKKHDIPDENISIQRELIPLIVLRVDKRATYFEIFHQKTKINELKQAALTAYWILKFKPFMIINDVSLSYEHRHINEGFALYYIICSMERYSVLVKEKTSIVQTASAKLIDFLSLASTSNKGIPEEIRNELMYAFIYWDLSKESVILITETIGKACFGININDPIDD